jgi:hypothetical protein
MAKISNLELVQCTYVSMDVVPYNLKPKGIP